MWAWDEDVTRVCWVLDDRNVDESTNNDGIHDSHEMAGSLSERVNALHFGKEKETPGPGSYSLPVPTIS